MAPNRDIGEIVALPLTGAAGLSPLVGLLRALKPFGASPAALVANATAGLRQAGAESRTSFRDRFASEFEEVTEALGARTMLIMIDDLDRCRPDSVLEVMEGINFLVSSGECFVVLGMARERVERAVGLSFKEIAREMVSQQEGPLGDAEKEVRERQARWEYGRHYLEKLINIEIPVPALRSDQAGQLLKADRLPGNWTSSWKRITFGAVKVLGAIAALLLAAAIFQYGYDLPPLRSDKNTPSATESPGGAPSATDANASAAGAGAVSPNRTVRADDGGARAVELIPGQEARPSLGWMFAGLILFVAGAVVLVLSRPQIVVKDSKSFLDALAVWSDVILATQDTPRKLKRFMNRLRWLAMRTRKIGPTPGIWARARQAWDDFLGRGAAEAPGTIPEAVLVGLAALQATGKDIAGLESTDWSEFVTDEQDPKGKRPLAPTGNMSNSLPPIRLSATGRRRPSKRVFSTSCRVQ